MRTKKSILNFITSFFPWILTAIIGFPKIHLFISNYGSELNGLTQLVYQIFSYFGLAEMGFGAAISFKLYKLFAENDREKISCVFTGAVRIYRKIGTIIFSLGFIAAFAFMFFLKSSELSRGYIFTIILLNSIDYLLIYFVLMPYQTLLIADQKKYKVNIIVNTKLVLFKITELILIYAKIPYILIVITGICFNLISNFLVLKHTFKTYPWLNKKSVPDYSTIDMSKDVFVHKISKIIFTNTDAILLSVFQGGLLSVSIYSSYNYIMSYLKQIFEYIINSPLESFGNLFATNEKMKKKIKIYNEYFSLSIFISILFSTLFYVSALSFVKIWLGEKYLISEVSVLLFALLLYSNCIYYPIYLLISVTGKFKQTKNATIVATLLNIVLSILLVKKYQISGVLFATIISQIFVIIPNYVKYVYTNVLLENKFQFYKKFFFSLFLTIVLIFIDKFIISYFGLYSYSSYINWFLSSLLIGFVDFIIIGIIMFLVMKSFRDLLNRFKGMVIKK